MATTFNLDITKGSTFSVRLVAKEDSGDLVNLSGYDARAHLKYRYSSTVPLIDFQPVVHPSLISGLIDIDLTAAQTADLPVMQGVYDLEIFTTGGYAMKLIKGYANVHPEVTI